MRPSDLTICICAYNAESYILLTLESLLSQTLQGWRLLIADDCSRDGTVSVVREYLSRHRDVEWELVLMEENRGTAYLRQRCLEQVKTPLVMFFDADDIAKPEMVEKLFRVISQDDELIAVSSYCDYMDAAGKPLRGGIYLGPTSKRTYMAMAVSGKNMFLPYTAMFRRDYALKAGGYRQAEWFPVRGDGIRYQDMSEDVDLWGRMSDFYQEGKCILVLPETLFFYRKNTNSLSTGFSKARVMGQKLLYIKANLTRRRAGKEEIKFQEFWDSLSLWKRLNFERKNLGAYFYRCACFAWVKKRLLPCVGNLFLGLLCTPLYPWEKYRANFRKKK